MDIEFLILLLTVDATPPWSIYAGYPPLSWTAFPALQARSSSPAADPESLGRGYSDIIMKTLSLFASALLAAVADAAVNVRCVPTSISMPIALRHWISRFNGPWDA